MTMDTPDSKPVCPRYTKPAGNPFHLFLDWDGTITQRDTMDLLAQAALRSHPTSSRHAETWDAVVSAYVSDMSTHTSDYRPPVSERRTLSQEMAWLESLAPHEQRSAERAASSGLFDALTQAQLTQHIARAVDEGQLQLRPGLAELLGLAAKTSGARVSVVSVNWSRTLIWAGLRRWAEGLLLWPAQMQTQTPQMQTQTQTQGGAEVTAPGDPTEGDSGGHGMSVADRLAAARLALGSTVDDSLCGTPLGRIGGRGVTPLTSTSYITGEAQGNAAQESRSKNAPKMPGLPEREAQRTMQPPRRQPLITDQVAIEIEANELPGLEGSPPPESAPAGRRGDSDEDGSTVDRDRIPKPQGGTSRHRLRTSADKLAAMGRLLELHAVDISTDSSGAAFASPPRVTRGGAADMDPSGLRLIDRAAVVVYVGDSPTDVECLLAADVGVCVRDEPLASGQRALKQALERIGVQTMHVSEFCGRLRRGEDDGGIGVDVSTRVDEQGSLHTSVREGQLAHDDEHGEHNALSNDNGRLLWWARDFLEITQTLQQLSSNG